MMSESESLEAENASILPLKDLQSVNSMANGLELLDDEQTLRLVQVIAEDMRIKCELFSIVR